MNAEALLRTPGFSGLPLSSESMEDYGSSISRIIPEEIISQAMGIVAAHRPEGSNPLEDPLLMAGLKPTHHGDLNRPSLIYPGGAEARNARIAELRAEYSTDKVAQQQIDVYADDTEYHTKLHEYVEAMKTGDEAKQ